MTPQTPADSLAAAAGALLHDHDITDVLLHLAQDATRFTGADAAGVLVRSDTGLELLSSTSHAATQLELFQAQRDEGPCLDVLGEGKALGAAGRSAILDRWPTVGPVIVEAGFLAVHAFPLAWRDGVIGGLNLFGREPRELDEVERRTAQSFADMVTLAVAHPDRLREDDVVRRVRRALGGRVLIEQAKGALAHRLGVDMAAAYDELVARSSREGTTVTVTAREVLRQAQLG